MPRTTKLLSVSLPPDLAEEYEALAKRLRKSKSELFREMIAAYKILRDEQERSRIQKKLARWPNRQKPWTEREVERIVLEDRW